MDLVRTLKSVVLAAVLGACSSSAMAQPKLVLTQAGSDISGDGNTVVGSILNANVFGQYVAFTRGVGFGFMGPATTGGDGRLQVSDVNAGAFWAATSLYNGSFGTPYWPPENPGLFGNYTGTRACCNGTICTVVDSAACTGMALYTGSATCEPNPCPPDPNPPLVGACCNRTTLVCTVTSQAACAANGAEYYWIGNLTTCGNYPCSHGHTIPFRYDSTTNTWTNAGAIPNNTGGPGQGSAHCDAGIATSYDISGNGRYITGGSWYGAFGTVACGTRGFIYDNTNGSVKMLPLVGTSAGCQNFSQGDRVSNNGVVVGRDMHATTTPTGDQISCNAGCLAVWEPDPVTGQYFMPRTPRACCTGSTCTVIDPQQCAGLALAATTCAPATCPAGAPATGACCNADSLNCSITTQAGCGSPDFWVGAGVCTPHNLCLPATETVLDEYGSGAIGTKVITRDGTVVAGQISDGTAEYELGDPSLVGSLCKYVKNSATGAWDRVILGKPAPRCQSVGGMFATAISADGNTIVGTAIYGGNSFFTACDIRGFIWSPSINEGVPMDFQTYVDSLNGNNPYPPTGSGLSIGAGISADGNAVMVTWTPPPPAACGNTGGLADLGRAGVLYLNGTGIGCEPPRIAGGPYNVAQQEFIRLGMVGNVFVAGSYPMTTQWQKETPTGSNNWVNLEDSCGQFTSDNSWTYEGTHGFQLRVNMLADPAARDGNYRVVITNSCGSATSQVADIHAVTGACCYNNGGAIACTLEMSSRCTGTLTDFGYLSGTYLGDNTVCTPTSCDAAAGACCFGPGGPNATCAIDVATHCTQSVLDGGNGGVFAGGGTVCGPAACGSVSGACCYSTDGVSTSCVVDLTTRCTSPVSSGGLAGVYAGNGTVCAPGDVCPAGTPGVGACCYNFDNLSEMVCTILPQTTCTATPLNGGHLGKYIGDGAVCGPSTCKPGVFGTGSGLGACCFTDPNNPASGVICTVRSRANCQNYPNGSTPDNQGPYTAGVAGIFQTGQCCSPSSTPPLSGCSTSTDCSPFYGACVHSAEDGLSDAVCTLQNQARCERRFYAGGLFGTFAGTQTVCSPASLQTLAGACCYTPPGETCPVCTIQPADPTTGQSPRCTEEFNGGLNGTFAGIGTTCTPASCPSVGACCVSGSCTPTCQALCDLNGGTFSGVGVACDPDPCNSTTGACCSGSTCATSTQAECTGVNTHFAGTGTVCNVFGTNNTTPCCLADYNQSGAVSVQDIFDFLSGYFTFNMQADINASGMVSVQDIFDFLGAYFSGCN